MQTEQLNLFHQHTVTALLGSVTALLFCVYVLKDVAAPVALMSWAGFGIAILTGRLVLHLIYQGAPERITGTYWLWLNYLGIALTGMTWGYAGLALVPADPLSLALVIIVVGGISATTSALYAALRGMSALFSITAMTPYAWRMISMGSEMFLMLGIILCVFILVMVLTAERMHQATMRSLRFGLEKDAMIREQQQARLQTLQLNQELLSEISDRRAAEQRIESSERELSRILDNMQDTYYCADLDGKVRRVSASVEDLLGYRTHEIIGKPLSDTYVDPQGR
jgi:hypothetical protein